MMSAKIAPGDQRRFEVQIVELIRTGRMPTLEQVHAAIETTRQKFLPLILAARNEKEKDDSAS